MTQLIKICSKCKRELPATLEYFYYCKDYKDKLRHHCKDCWKEYKRIHRQQVAKSRKEWKKKNHKKELFLRNLHRKVRKLKSTQKHCSICNEEKKL